MAVRERRWSWSWRVVGRRHGWWRTAVVAGVVVDGGTVVVVVVDVVVVVASGSGRLNDGSDSRFGVLLGFLAVVAPHVHQRRRASTSSGNTSASVLEMRMQPCDAGRVGTFCAPWMAMP